MTPLWIATGVTVGVAGLALSFIFGWSRGYVHGHADGNSDGWRRRENFQRDMDTALTNITREDAQP